MARVQSGSIDGVHVALVTEALEQHSLVSALDPVREARIRDVLNGARDEILRVLESAARPAQARVRTRS